MGRKIAIVGTAPSSLHLAPWNDPEWEIWSCPGVFGVKNPNEITNLKYAIEIHSPENMANDFGSMDFFKALPCTLLVREVIPGIEKQEVYPLEQILAAFPRRYFTNTISWGLAFAIWQHMLGEPIETIGIWGVDMAAGGEYAHQRPSCEYFVGWAEGQGIEVIIPDESDLCKAALLYGFEAEKISAVAAKYKVRVDELTQRQGQIEAQVKAKILLREPKKVNCPHCKTEFTISGEFDYPALQLLLSQAHLRGCQENMAYLINQRVGID